MKISVITPFYKDAKYISQCLASLESQTLGDFEVILIDDCGNDGTFEIANSWCLKCESNFNFQVAIIRNETNKGSSASRNRALDIAKGEYVVFLDADDYLVPQALEKIADRMDRQALDDMYFNAHSFYESLSAHRLVRENYDHRKSFDDIYSGKELFAKMVNCGQLFPQGALRAYRRDFLYKNNLKFKEDNIHEDLLLLVQAIAVSSRTSFLNEPIYLRRVHCNSKMGRRKRTIKNVTGHFETLLWFKNWMDENREGCDEIFCQAYERFMEKYARLCARDIGWFIEPHELEDYLNSLSTEDREQFESIITKPYLHEYEKNQFTSPSRKLIRLCVLPFRGVREVFLYIKERR